jgi:hypothetical protein
MKRNLFFSICLFFVIYTNDSLKCQKLISDQDVVLNILGDFMLGSDETLVCDGGLVLDGYNVDCYGKLRLVNGGNVRSYFKNANLENATVLLEGMGEYFLENLLAIDSVIINMDGKLYVSGDLPILNCCQLSKGVIIFSTGNKLNIFSSDEKAILLPELEHGYVVGNVSRNVMTGKSYVYPLASLDGEYYPAYLSNVERNDNVSVQFDPNISNVNVNDEAISIDGIGWEIKSNDALNSYNLSLYGGDEVDIDTKIAYIPLNEASSIIHDHTIYNVSGFLNSSERLRSGRYFFAKPLNITFPNFLLSNSQYDINAFVVPNSSDYDRIELIVYDRLGDEVFSSYEYTNQFKASDYPSGTYFYSVVLHKNGKKIKRNKFIEIKHGK